ncbi:MAG: YcaQ family DNA glycosylase [Microbacteriaceae bacterium]|nr:YcaQ family DNA glycosylase [Microbacteriaceae bacterium]
MTERPADRLTAGQARRILLAAQGFGGAPKGLETTVRRLQLLQLDSVNVFERSHYLPLHARLGHYDKARLDRLTFADPGRWTEWWAHEAALFPVEDLPLWAWKKAEYRARDPWFPDFAGDHEALMNELLEVLRADGPLAASDIEHEENRRHGPWWGWSAVKRGLEILFRRGDVVSAGRTRFERRYALPEQVLPASVLGAEVARADAIRELVRRSAIALGVGTTADLADYFRLRTDDTRAAVAELADAGELLPVRVDGWKQPAWLHRDARRPARLGAAALLSPFDPVVWDRDRAERQFGFRYRIEIYTPAPKRVYGYYSLPILLDDHLVGRIDLKSDRKARVLRVQSAWREEGPGVPAADPRRVAELVRAAAVWQGLDDVTVADWGTLTADLRAALA